MDEKAKIGDIKIKVGQPTEVSLHSNAGATGYVWFLTHTPDILWLGDIEYVGPKPAIPGRPWKKIFTFIGGKKGEDYLEFNLVKPWKPNEVVQKAVYSVSVHENGNAMM